MSSGFSHYLNNQLLDLAFGADSFTPADPLYVAAMTALPNAGGGGTEVGTGVWTNYARVAIDNDLVTWSNAASSAKSNDIEIDFGTAAITGTPPVILGIAIYDDPTAGNLYGWYGLAVGKTINDTDPVTIPIGDMDIAILGTA